jgi:hypothetical protein
VIAIKKEGKYIKKGGKIKKGQISKKKPNI